MPPQRRTVGRISKVYDRLKQTCIDHYFKMIKSNLSSSNDSRSDSDELTVSARKRARAIYSDSEDEDDVNNTSLCEQQPSVSNATPTLPFPLPSYTYSDDESDGHSNNIPTLKAMATACDIKSEANCSLKKVPNQSASKRRLRIKEFVSSDDEDFVINSKKSRYCDSLQTTPSKKQLRKGIRRNLFNHVNDKGANTNSERILKCKNVITQETPTVSTHERDLNKSGKVVVNEADNQSKNITSDLTPKLRNASVSLKRVTILGDILKSSSCNSQPTQKQSSVDNESPTKLQKCTDNKSNNVKNELDSEDKDQWRSITVDLFIKMKEYVVSHDHLKTMLTNAEMEMLTRFCAMEFREYKFFCLKLFTRMQKWYNIFNLRTLLKMAISDPEVCDMYKCLSENGFVEVDTSQDDCIDLLSDLPRHDVMSICEGFKIKSATKAEAVQKLLKYCSRQSTLSLKSSKEVLQEKIKERMGYCIKIHPDLYSVFKKLHFLYTFFTSEFETPNDLYWFLSKIERKSVVLPDYTVNENVAIFLSPSEFLSYVEACECKNSVMKAFQSKNIFLTLEQCKEAYIQLQKILTRNQEQLSSYRMRFTAGHKYTRALTFGLEHLAKHYPDKAEEWLKFLLHNNRYCLHLHGYWYDLLVKVQYFYLKKYEEAADTIIKALKSKDLSQVDYHELSHRAEAMKRSKRNQISKLKLNNISFVQPTTLRDCPFTEIEAQTTHDNKSGRKRLYVQKVAGERQIFSVEEIALQYYYRKGFANGIHCEGSLFETLFFVLFWDIIYESPVKDVFVVKIQYFPLDLYSTEFYTNRKTAVDQRLDEIKFKWPFSQLKNFICEVWQEHSQKKSFINSNIIDNPDQLYDIVLCIGRPRLTDILRRIVTNFKLHHSGVPDLFLWNVKIKKCKYVEVKGENDTLSTKQRLWLDFLLSIEADAEVCYVHTIGSRSRKLGNKPKRKRNNTNITELE